jgi:hypothetical protein
VAGHGPTGSAALQNVPAQVLVLHDAGKLLAHVGGVHLNGLLLQIWPREPKGGAFLDAVGVSTLGTGRAKLNVREDAAVDVLVERLDARLREWKPETAAQVRECVSEVIELADHDVLDLMRPRAIEQEVLDLLDEPTTR